MSNLLKNPFHLIVFIVMVVLCVLSFKFTEFVVWTALFCTLALHGIEKKTRPNSSAWLPPIMMSWVTLIFASFVSFIQSILGV
jgi:hypothetical protein